MIIPRHLPKTEFLVGECAFSIGTDHKVLKYLTRVEPKTMIFGQTLGKRMEKWSKWSLGMTVLGEVYGYTPYLQMLRQTFFEVYGHGYNASTFI